MRKTMGTKQCRRAVLLFAAVCASVSFAGCAFGASDTYAELEVTLANAEGGESPDNPVNISFNGTETAFAIYVALANARKYVNLDLSESSVTGFGSSAYPAGSRWIVSLVLPDNLKKIGGEAFAGWTQLRHIFISDSVTMIGEKSFQDCASLAAITIPESVEYIGRDAFSSCDNLNAVAFMGDGAQIADNTVFPSGAKFREAAARSEHSGSGSYMASRGVYVRDGTEWSRK